MLLRKMIIGIGGVLLALVALAGGLYLFNSIPGVPAVSVAEIAAPTRPYVVKLHAQWCPVCLQTRDEWAQISKTYAGRVNLFVFDSTNESTIARSRDAAARLRLDQILASYEGASGLVLVINPRTLQVEAEVGGNHPFESYRKVIDSMLVAAPLDDHFGPAERVLESFGWQPGASCQFEDAIGVVFHGDWQKRHWIKLEGKQVEFNGEVEMSDPGWFQTFRTEAFTVTMRRRRTGDRGDGVPMVGQIVIERSGKAQTFEVKGGCGA